jgi:hypothetical protein
LQGFEFELCSAQVHKKYALSYNKHFNLKQTLLDGVDAEARAIKKARVHRKYSLSYSEHFNLGRVKMSTQCFLSMRHGQ